MERYYVWAMVAQEFHSPITFAKWYPSLSIHSIAVSILLVFQPRCVAVEREDSSHYGLSSTTNLADIMNASIKNLNMDPGIMGRKACVQPRGKMNIASGEWFDTASRSCDSPPDHHH